SEGVAQDTLSWSKEKGAFVAVHGEDGAKSNSKITSLLDGTVSKGSTDAVTGSQLFDTNKTVATYLGGGAGYEEGKWTVPNFKVKTIKDDGNSGEESYTSVSAAFEGVGTSFTNIKNEITNQINHLQSEDSAVVHYDKKKDGKTDYGNITFGGKDEVLTALHNVGDGKIAEDSHDAINGSQLFATDKKVSIVSDNLKVAGTNIAKVLGGGAKYEEDKWTAPSFKVKTVKDDGSDVEEQSYESVSAAFEGVGTSFTNIHKELKNEITKVVGDSLVKQDAASKVIKIGAEKGGTSINIANSGDAARSLLGVKAGLLTEGSTEAVNGSQLYSMSNTLASYLGGGAGYKEGKWSAPSFKVNTISEDGSKVEEKSYDDVVKAFAGVGSSFTNIHKELKNEITKVVGDSLVKQDEKTRVIAVGGEKSGTEVTFANVDHAARTLTGVKAGKLSDVSTEAVNGSQLYSLHQRLASYLGGGASYENDAWTAPSFKIVSFKEDGSSEETIYDNVAAAFAGVNNSFTKLQHDLSDNIAQNALLWSDDDKAFVAVHGKGDGKHNSKLSHLVDGDISAGSTEAITGNQLYQLDQTLALYLGGGAKYENGQWTGPQFQVRQFKSDGSSDDSKSYDNVAGAFEGVNGSLSGMNDRINNVAQNVSSNGLNWNEELGSYDGRHNGVDSKLTHVADGDVSEGSKEVVNGGQLWETNKKVEAVEERVENIDQQVQAIENTFTNDVVKYDKGEDGKKTNKITLVGGNESDPVLIENVGDGRIESGSKEAVNGGQLHDYTDQQMKIVLDDAKKYTDDRVNDIVSNGVNESKAYTDMKFETLNYAVEDVRKEARQAAAIGLAVSN
ncbi:hypothetical protein, partial [Bartonella sp. ML71XJBT]|uniref:hypothetical protein n=1 Tax=Bartonella sp. ML71XJBT TaxID=3019094 RepID=UPI00235EF940